MEAADISSPEGQVPPSSMLPPPRADAGGVAERAAWRERQAEADRRARRRAALVILAASSALLGVAAYLEPNPAGLATHRQLNLPPCGWVVGFGIPCPTCGMTTAFAAAAEGRLIMSFLAQPLGFVLAVLTASTAVVSAFVAVTGSAVGGLFLRLVTPRVGWFAVGALALAWVYKVIAYRMTL